VAGRPMEFSLMDEVERGSLSVEEPLLRHGDPKPVPWRVRLPSSWTLETPTSSDEAASFQASKLRGEELVGKLAVAVIGREVMKRPRDVANVYLESLDSYGLEVERDDFAAEEAAPPFEQSWCLESPVLRSGAVPGEVRCRVLRHERAWVIAGMLSPRREDDPPAWDENRRTLDLVTRTFRIKG
jgi:hypothetical protein